MDAAQQHAVFSNDAPKVVKALDEGIGGILNGAIEKCGAVADACTAEARGMGKKGIADLSGSSLAGDPGSMPAVGKGKSENIQSQGRSQQIEKSVGPEMQLARQQATGASNGMKTEHVAEADLGAIAPTAVSAGMAQTQSQGMSI